MCKYIKYFQIFANICKCMQIYKYMQMYVNIFKFLQIYVNISKYMQIYVNICKYNQMQIYVRCPNFHFPELFGRFEFRILNSLKNYLGGSNFELRIRARFICRLFVFRINLERNYDRTFSLFQGVFVFKKDMHDLGPAPIPLCFANQRSRPMKRTSQFGLQKELPRPFP